MEQRISLVTLGVQDLARVREFYETLGWSGARQPDNEVCFFQAGGMVFGLWTALGGHGAPGIELAHNVRSSAEVSAVLAEAERAGATIVRSAGRADWGGTSGAFADPEGYVGEVAHNPGWTLQTTARSTSKPRPSPAPQWTLRSIGAARAAAQTGRAGVHRCVSGA
ncbi:MAG: VOC family protein [Solirubrobacterales bacterium]|nr:VOC family protein [Solirubrobacterales bacterium]